MIKEEDMLNLPGCSAEQTLSFYEGFAEKGMEILCDDNFGLDTMRGTIVINGVINSMRKSIVFKMYLIQKRHCL
ncbi:MAG: hypothetical protein AABY15_06990 [Nanoarchaeota archaeon]